MGLAALATDPRVPYRPPRRRSRREGGNVYPLFSTRSSSRAVHRSRSHAESAALQGTERVMLRGRVSTRPFSTVLQPVTLNLMRCRKLLPGLFGVLSATILAAGCWPDEQATKSASNPAQKSQPVEPKKAPMGQNVWLEIQGQKRRVVIDAYVCLREGLLEHLMC